MNSKTNYHILTLIVGLLMPAFFVHASPNFSLLHPSEDCSGALVICDDSPIMGNASTAGDNDFADPDNQTGCLFGGEHLSTWYYVQFSPDTPPGAVLEFTIESSNPSDDYDFAIWGAHVSCDNLGAPIRCSSSAGGSITGLSSMALDEDEGPTGDGFVKALEIQAGDGFFLLVDGFSQSFTGFELTLGGSAAPFIDCTNLSLCEMTTTIAGIGEPFICSGQVHFLNGQVSNFTGSLSYAWTVIPAIAQDYIASPNAAQTLVTFPADAPLNNYIFTFTATQLSDSCTASSTVEYSLSMSDTISLDPIVPICQQEMPIQLSVVQDGVFGEWAGVGVNNNTFYPNGLNGEVVLTFTPQVGQCAAAATVVVEVLDATNEACLSSIPPILVLRNGLNISLQEDETMLLPAHLFNIGSYSLEGDDLQFSYSQNVQDSVRIFSSCPQSFCTESISIWATNSHGQQNVVENFILIQGGCSNDNTLTDDCKIKPIIKNGLTCTLNQDNEITVQARSFDIASSSDCGLPLTFSFSPNPSDSIMSYDDENLGTATVCVWLTDPEGRQTSCETFLIVQNFPFQDDCLSTDVCAPNPIIQNGLLLGLPPDLNEIKLPVHLYEVATYDNCGTEIMTVSLSENTSMDSIHFYCEQLGTESIDVFFTNTNQVQSFVTSYYLVQRNIGLCPEDSAVSIYCQVQDSLALIDFYQAVEGLDWDVEELVRLWRGINLDRNGYVKNIRLSDKNLSGHISPALGNLSRLESLQLDCNNLSGTIPESLGNLSQLHQLFLFNNQLTGVIPAELGQLNQLVQFYVQNNDLEGCFAEELAMYCALGYSEVSYALGYNFSNNPKLAWEGDFEPFCAGASSVWASCDDGNPDSSWDRIFPNCACEGILLPSNDTLLWEPFQPIDIARTSSLSLQLYPNPVQNYLVFDIVIDEEQVYDAQIFSSTGRYMETLQLQQPSTILNLRDYTVGTYFIVLKQKSTATEEVYLFTKME